MTAEKLIAGMTKGRELSLSALHRGGTQGEYVELFTLRAHLLLRCRL